MPENQESVRPRSSYSAPSRRKPLPWPKDQPFRILSLDGGGIKGIFPAAILAKLEEFLPEGEHIHQYFDLIAGTSTGGILAMGVGAGITAETMLRLYLERGSELFPPGNAITRGLRGLKQFFAYKYDADNLARLLKETYGDRRIQASRGCLCIPTSEGMNGEIFVVKTPHHPDYHLDGKKLLVEVGLATGAAPTYLKAADHWGYRLADGGLWANNPILVAVIEALSAFDVTREQIQVLSIGCGNDKVRVTNKMASGGLFQWRKAIKCAINLQTQSALAQTRLLLGPERVIRLEPKADAAIDLDDWVRARAELPAEAEAVCAAQLAAIKARFLQGKASTPKFF